MSIPMSLLPEDQHTSFLQDISNLSLQSDPSLPPPPLIFDAIQNIASHTTPHHIPPHRSHSPSNNLKRSEPFQFGSRYLEEGDNVYEFNAWDHVLPDPIYTAYAEHQYKSQRAQPVSEFDARRFNAEPEKWWNKFYTNNTAKFFKDRKWLRQEFPALTRLTAKPEFVGRGDRVREIEESVILEVGAGAGNTAFPILAANENPGLRIHACDFSKKAVGLIKENEAYDGKYIRAEVWDIASSTETLPPGVKEGSVDIVLLIFIFSALSPRQWKQAVKNLWRALKPGGEVCFRDYGRGDLAQVRFKKGRWMEENFYARGDGTRVYFFDEEELRKIWTGTLWREGTNGDDSIGIRIEGKGSNEIKEQREALENPMVGELCGMNGSASFSQLAFEIVSLGIDRRLLVNRQKKLKMYRSVSQIPTKC
ncbi:hypothetical protein MMC06_006144 [Schaereria dolodes]|nr:hypothetical protein [Schaereria dolodes]